MMNLLDNFRKSTLDNSIKSASQRLSKQRRLLNKEDLLEKKQAYESLAQEHFNSITKSELHDFGLSAMISNPGTLIDDPADKTGSIQKLISGERVMVSAGNNQTKQLFCGLDDGSITVWSVPDGKWIAHGMSGHNDGFSFSGFATRGISCSSSNDLVASTHRNGVLALWKSHPTPQNNNINNQPPAQVSPISTLKTSTSSLRQCKFSPTVPTCLATTNDEGSLQLWDVVASSSSPQLFLSLENGLPTTSTNQSQQQQRVPPTRCLSFHPDGALVCVGDASGAFSIWDLRDASRIYNSASLKPLHTGRINDIQFSSNGYNFCSGGDDGLLYCFDLRRLPIPTTASTTSTTTPSSSNNFVWRQAAHGDAVTSITFGKAHSLMQDSVLDSSVVFSGGLDGLVVAWDSWTGEQVWKSDPEEPSYTPLISTTPSTLRPVRSLCYFNLVGGETFLAVMRREPQWLIFSPNSGGLEGVKSITTEAQVTTKQQAQAQALTTTTTVGNQNSDDKDSDDDDDDIMGALRRT